MVEVQGGGIRGLVTIGIRVCSGGTVPAQDWKHAFGLSSLESIIGYIGVSYLLLEGSR